MKPKESVPTPQIVTYGAKPIIDAEAAGRTFQQVGMTPDFIRRSSVHIKDDAAASFIRGNTKPNFLHRLRYGDTAWNQENGAVITLYTTKKGQPRPLDQINATLVHEAEHATQIERKDPRLLMEVAIYPAAITGGIVANRLVKNSNNRLLKIGAFLFGAAAGYQATYKIAPHEVQARKRAKEIPTDAIRMPG